ncbi:unnamed protein product [Allacma fusca]|uniref:Uncharacterized protein n=1 Tax=Allacma fusca TaxID=39272 RepID=A0A8J2KQK9_9HEXA|nr:unnamed protein product [Allacma fusca]
MFENERLILMGRGEALEEMMLEYWIVCMYVDNMGRLTLLTPLSLQYHQNNHSLQNNLQHHTQQSLAQQQQQQQQQQMHQQPYATTHRTFPSAQTSDLIFSSLNRKPSRSIVSERGSSGSDTDGRISGRLWYADIVHGHPHNHSNHNGGGYNHSGINGGLTGLHHPPQILPQQQQLPQVLPNGRHNGFVPGSYVNGRNGTKSSNQPGVNTLNPNAFPLVRGSEINV